MNRLNGWQRIGIIISVIAFIPLYLKFADEYTVWAKEQSNIAYKSCMSAQALIGTPIDDKNICVKESMAIYHKHLEDKFLNGIARAFFSIVIFWLFLGAFISKIIGPTIRWVIAGFRK